MSVLDPLTCGFAKVFIYELLMKDSDRLGKNVRPTEAAVIYTAHHRSYLEQFSEGTSFEVTYEKFKSFVKIKENVVTLGKSSTEKKIYVLQSFSSEVWKKLTSMEKQQHSFLNCGACLKNEKFRLPLSYFPIKVTHLKRRAEEAGLFKPQKQVLIDITKKTIKSLDKQFKEQHSVTFQKAISLCCSVKQIEKKSEICEGVKKDIERQWKETSVSRLYGSNLSKRQYREHRLARSFESNENAQQRTSKDKEKIAAGLKRPHDHVGKLENFSWDSAGCLAKVESLPDDDVVNYTQLAKDFNLLDANGKTPKNAGQVVKELLSSSGCNLGRFSSYTTKSRIRRMKRRLIGTDVTMPTEERDVEVTDQLKDLISKGVYSMGECLVPQEFESLTLNDGKIETETFTVKGRKHPVEVLREKFMKKQHQYMRLHPDSFYENMERETLRYEWNRLDVKFDDSDNFDESVASLKILQRQRHLGNWHDTSCVSNHSHLLIMFFCLYDKAIFYTNKEYLEKTGMKSDVQTNIEQPELYILARCPSNDKQIMYSDARLEDITNWSITASKVGDIMLNDVVRIFKGDAPACQFEAGHKKGGHFFCWACGMKADRSNDLGHVFNLTHTSLEMKIQTVTASTYGKGTSNKMCLHYTDNISKVDLLTDLNERGVRVRAENKKDMLLKLLEAELQGCQRLPALLYHTPKSSLLESNLASYEVLSCEPLHCVSGHIKNLYQELPHHLNKEESKLFNNTVTFSFSGKEAKRGADYRLSLIDCTKYLQGKIDANVYELMLQTCEIQGILYDSEEHRTPTSILRLYNQSFKHAMLLNEVISNTVSLTKRKMYGQYYHSLIVHAPEQYRLFSGPTTNTEEEERTFNFLKTMSTHTSNHHPENVLFNAFIRLQVRDNVCKQDIQSDVESKISKRSQLLERRSNSIIPYYIIEKDPWTYQAHLERIADYLLIPGFWKEADSGIEFSDMDESKTPKKFKHHFRNQTIQTEKNYLKKCWEKCLAQPNTIPALKVKVESSNGDVRQIHLNTLSFARLINEPEDEVSDFDMSSKPSSPPVVKKVFDPMPLSSGNYRSHTTSTPITENIQGTPTGPPKMQKTCAFVIKKKDIVSTEQGKTACLLEKVLGPNELITQYERIRKLFKTSPTTYQQELKNLSAQLEIKIAIARDQLKNDIKEIEVEQLRTNTNMSIIGDGTKSDYNTKLKKLTIIKKLHCQFDF